AHIKQFGQSLLETVSLPKLTAIAKLLEVYPKVDKESMEQKLLDAGLDEVLVTESTVKDLRILARAAGVKLGNTSEELRDAINSIPNADTLTDVQMKGLSKHATKLGGIERDLEGDELLSAIQRRVDEEFEDVLRESRKQFIREGGKADRFDDIARLIQGIPLKSITRSKVWRWTHPMRAIIGAMHVSLAAIPNLTQVMNLVPGYTGWLNLAKAVGQRTFHKKDVETRLQDMGAMRVKIMPSLASTYEAGHTMQNVGRIVRDVGTRVTFLKWALQRNEAIAGEAF
ncbi:unnamed protein product, partial [marine sediment metagenome]